jgi:hypothetical protein
MFGTTSVSEGQISHSLTFMDGKLITNVTERYLLLIVKSLMTITMLFYQLMETRH